MATSAFLCCLPILIIMQKNSILLLFLKLKNNLILNVSITALSEIKLDCQSLTVKYWQWKQLSVHIQTNKIQGHNITIYNWWCWKSNRVFNVRLCFSNNDILMFFIQLTPFLLVIMVPNVSAEIDYWLIWWHI